MMTQTRPRFRVVKGSPAEITGMETDWSTARRARKERPCEHSGPTCDRMTQPCPGPIQPGEFYADVRMGSWLELAPVRLECLVAAGWIKLLGDPE